MENHWKVMGKWLENVEFPSDLEILRSMGKYGKIIQPGPDICRISSKSALDMIIEKQSIRQLFVCHLLGGDPEAWKFPAHLSRSGSALQHVQFFGHCVWSLFAHCGHKRQ
jgi:hypothetical protein